MDLKKIGSYIAGKRKERGMTQRELAEKLGMSDKSVSKWERGICLPDVSVYTELCGILGITLNEFLAGEDIDEKDVTTKSEKNIIEVTKDGYRRQKKLRKVIAALTAVIILAAAAGSAYGLYSRFIKPQNYIEPVASNSMEARAVEMMNSGTFYRFNTRDEYRGLTVYVTEYRNGKFVDKWNVFSTGEGKTVGGEGMFALAVDDNEHTAEFAVILEDEAESTEFPIYKGKNDDGYTGRSISGLEEKLEIEPGTEQGIAALFFDDYEMRRLPVSAIEEENGGAENDCVYYFSVEFTE